MGTEAKKATRVECHRVLGIVAVRRGDPKQAEAMAKASILAGMEEARDTGPHLPELLCARDVRKFVVWRVINVRGGRGRRNDRGACFD